MSSKSIALFEARKAPTTPPPPDCAEHIRARAKAKRVIAARLLAEAEELELAASRMEKRK